MMFHKEPRTRHTQELDPRNPPLRTWRKKTDHSDLKRKILELVSTLPSIYCTVANDCLERYQLYRPYTKLFR
jgi:hypothetical protein